VVAWQVVEARLATERGPAFRRSLEAVLEVLRRAETRR
jgi:hypothetical protein